MKAWQRALALVAALAALHGLMVVVARVNYKLDIYEDQYPFISAARFAIGMSVLLLPLLLTLAILPRRPLAARLASKGGMRARLWGAAYTVASLIPGLLLVLGTVFWSAPHHHALALAYALALACAAWAFLADAKRLFPSLFNTARAVYLSLLAVAALLLAIDGDHIAGMRPSPQETLRRQLAPQDLSNSEIYRLISGQDGTLLANVGAVWLRSTDQGISWTPIYPQLGRDGASIVKLRSGALIAAVRTQGIMRSADSGLSWHMLRPLTDADDAVALSLAPDGTLYYLGGGHVMSSKDEGSNWSEPGRFLDSDGDDLLPSFNHFAAQADCTAYVDTNADGMFRSGDCGLTWKPFSMHGELAALHAANDGSLLAIFDHQGIVRSTDHGAHWKLVRIEPEPDDEVSQFLSTQGMPLFASAGDHILRSEDNGISWVPLQGKLEPDVFAVTRSTGGTLFAGTRLGLYRSADDGASWDKVASPPPPPQPRRPYLLSALEQLF